MYATSDALNKNHLFATPLIILGVLTIMLLAGSCNHREEQTEVPKQATTNRITAPGSVEMTVEEAVAILDSSPNWISSSDCRSDAEKLIYSIQRIKRLSTADMRRVIEITIQKSLEDNRNGHTHFDTLSKIYLLNRIIFAVPDAVVMKNRIWYGGWRGVPYKNGVANLQWPLRILPNDTILMTDCFQGYSGDTYDALGEFDSFNSSFGRRR